MEEDNKIQDKKIKYQTNITPWSEVKIFLNDIDIVLGDTEFNFFL